MALLKMKEAASYLTISVDTLRAERDDGRILAIKTRGTWRFDTRDLDKYIDDKRQEAAEAAELKQKRRSQKKGNITPLRKMASGGNAPLVKHWVPGMKIEDVCGLSEKRVK